MLEDRYCNVTKLHVEQWYVTSTHPLNFNDHAMDLMPPKRRIVVGLLQAASFLYSCMVCDLYQQIDGTTVCNAVKTCDQYPYSQLL